MSDTALRTEPSIDSIWRIEINIQEVKAAYAVPAQVN